METNNLTFNVVSNRTDTVLGQATTSWSDLKVYFTSDKLDVRPEKDGIGIIPCSVLDPAGRREQSNMDKMYLLMLDCDEGKTVEEFVEKLQGIEAQVHTTYSHTLEKPKVRAAIPLKTPIEARRAHIVFDYLNERFDGLLDTSCGHDSARLFYMPSCPPGRESLFQSVHIEGKWFDAQAILDAYDKSMPTFTTIPASRGSAGAPKAEIHGVNEGGRNNAGFKLACQLFKKGKSDTEVTAALKAWNDTCSPPMDLKEVAEIVKSAEKKVARSEAVDAKVNEELVLDMNSKYIWIKKHNKAYRVAFGDFVSIEQLRQTYANKRAFIVVGGKIRNLTQADIWHQSPQRQDYDNVDFMPGKPPVHKNCLNLWEGWPHEPSPGDITPWIEMMDHVFAGNPEPRKWFEQFLAYPVQHPGAKLSMAAVIWSLKQGVGKSMIGETMCKLYGTHGRMITAAELHSPYNPWMKGAQFILGEENSSADRRADSNRLKVLITGATVTVNDKYQPAIELTNAANFVFTSNDPSAFHMDDSDRRYWVWEITAERKPDEFYRKFAAWRDSTEGMSALMHHLLNLDLSGFLPKGNAPITDAKLDMIRQSKSDVERWLSELVEDPAQIKEYFGKDVVHIDDVTRKYNQIGVGRTNRTAISRALRRSCNYAKNRVSCKNGKRQNLISLTNHHFWEKADLEDWAKEYAKSEPLPLD